MAFQAVPDTAEAVMVFLGDGGIMTNTHYAKFFGMYDLDDLQDLANVYDEFAADDLVPQLANDVQYLRTEVRGLSAINDLTAQQAAGTGLGLQSSSMYPSNVSWAIKRLSGFTGRSARGRVYVPGIPRNNTQSAGDSLNLSYAGDLRAAFRTIKDHMAPFNWTEVIVSRWENGAKRLFGITFNIEDWDYTDLIIDSRRDRLPG